MSIIQGTSKSSAAGYSIDQSLRLDGTGDMSRTVSSDGNLRTWTFAFWLKRSTFGTNGGVGFNVGGTYVSADNRSIFRFHSSLSGGDDDWYWAERSGAAWREDQATTSMHRDPAAWAHYMCVWDTDGGTTPRARRYINGVLVSDLKSGGTAVAANVDSGTNRAGTFQLFDQPGFAGREFEGYAADMFFLDGVAATPSDFGEFSSDTGQFVPIAYSGSFGSNGFYLDFADSSDLGKDVSGNSNHFTTSSLSSSAQVTDSPTDNHCVLNALDGAGTLSDGNLVNAATGSGFVSRRATIGIPSSGKWAFRVKKSANNFMVGVMAPQATDGDPDTNGVDAVFYYDEDGTSSGDIQTRRSGSKVVEATNPPAGIAADTFMEVLIDKDNNRLGVVIGGTSYIAVDSGVAIQDTMTQIFVATAGSGVTATVDFGQSGFTPSQTGYKALSTANLDDPTIANSSDYFNTVLYTGNGATGQSITGVGFQPDFTWTKIRSPNAYSHQLFDAVRGAGKNIQSNASNAEGDLTSEFISFDSDGFTIDDVAQNVNESGSSYVSWNWKANGSGSSDSSGDITANVSASPTSGFAVLTYSGNGSDNQTIPHGLGTAPKMIITKRRDSSGNWTTYHDAVGINQVFYLNSTSAAASNTEQYRAVPTSSVYTVGVGGDINNSSGTYVAYVFAEVEGYSAIGSYIGNGSATDGPFVYTGMAPRFILFRVSSTSDAWQIYDTERYTFNPFGKTIAPNSSAVESSLSQRLDILSNGFKIRTTNTALNGSGQTYIYMAFGDPFKTATAR